MLMEALMLKLVWEVLRPKEGAWDKISVPQAADAKTRNYG
jgi:hypothetical protein